MMVAMPAASRARRWALPINEGARSPPPASSPWQAAQVALKSLLACAISAGLMPGCSWAETWTLTWKITNAVAQAANKARAIFFTGLSTTLRLWRASAGLIRRTLHPLIGRQGIFPKILLGGLAALAGKIFAHQRHRVRHLGDTDRIGPVTAEDDPVFPKITHQGIEPCPMGRQAMLDHGRWRRDAGRGTWHGPDGE